MAGKVGRTVQQGEKSTVFKMNVYDRNDSFGKYVDCMYVKCSCLR